MNLRNAWNHVRLHRIVPTILLLLALLIFAVFSIVASMWLLASIAAALFVGLVFVSVRPYMQWLHEAHGVRSLGLNRLSEAETHLRNSLRWANQLDPADPCRGRILELLTFVARKQGHYDDAEALGRDWRDAEERTWGSDHPRTAHAMETLADIYDQIARHHQARPLLENALRVREAHQQEHPKEYVECLDAIGSLWCRLEQYERAEPYFRKAYDLVQKRLDRTSPDSFSLAGGLCTVCVHLDQLDEAETLAQTALAYAEKHPEPISMPVAYCMSQLAYVRRFQDRFDEAEVLVQRSLEIMRKAVPKNEMVLHGDLHLLGVIHRYQSRWADAEECFRETLRIRQEYCAPEDLSIARVLEDYAELLELMGRMDEAGMHQNHAKQIRDFHSPFRLV